MMNKSRFFVPNFFTSLNFLLGCWAILFATGAIQSPSTAKISLIFGCHMVVYCVLLDKLDGFAAKVMNASSEFGAQFDSLADLIAFGLAPAFCLMYAYKEFTPEWYSAHFGLVLATFSLYVLCAALRLARYNAVDADAHPDWFVGLPSTLSGGINIVVIIIAYNHGFFEEGSALLPALAIMQILSAVLMVSSLYLPKLKKRENPIFNGVQIMGIIAGYICGFAMMFTEFILGLVAIYAIIGFSYGLLNRKAINEESNHQLETEEAFL